MLSYIQKLPDGMHTKLSPEKLPRIPRGISQLMTITKALARPCDIILFDEANTYLSIEADQKVILYLKKLIGKKTIILNSQRQSLNKIAEKTFYFKNKKLVEVNDVE